MASRATDIIHCRAPGKVNLSLAVLGRRKDGFHELESWVAPFDWCDCLTIAPAERLSIEVTGSVEGVPDGPSNLAYRAAERLAQAAGIPPHATIALEKRLPSGAGLGGGSSDAASALLGLNRLWDLNWPLDRLHPIAAEIGSDVPFFMTAGAAIMRGRGDLLERAPQVWQGWLALVLPPFGVSTASVYEAWASHGDAAPSDRPKPWEQQHTNSEAMMASLFNDLEAAAFAIEPRLATLHRQLDGMQDRAVRMTGSGSTLFTAFDYEVMAEAWRDEAMKRVDPEVEIRIVPTG